jgi:two-component system phosphate regulon sensor histidine kinase PhoR
MGNVGLLATPLAVGAVCFGLLESPEVSSWVPAPLGSAALSAALAGAVLLAGLARRSGRSSLRSLAGRLHDMSLTGAIRPIEAGPSGVPSELLEPLNEVLRAARARVDAAESDKKHLEIQSRIASAEKHQIEAIIFSISDAVLVTNRFDELILANESAERLLGFAFDPSQRKAVGEVLRDSSLVSLITEMRAHERIQHRKVAEHSIGEAGGTRTFRLTLSGVPGPNDKPAGVVAVLHDVTREKEVAAMKTDFVSNVSHELKTPLASIKAYVEMLCDGEVADASQREEFYQIISAETDRLSRLIENILNISRIEAGVVKVVRAPVSLTGVVKQALDVARPQARTKRIELHDNLAPVFYQVDADQDMIYQAVLNLLSNAIKYTPEGGAVTVRVAVDESTGEAICSVEDTGAGIPADDLPHIFDKFYRVKANKKLAKGTGLGLTLVKHIVETVHEGKLTVTSDDGKGSNFSLRLPVIK